MAHLLVGDSSTFPDVVLEKNVDVQDWLTTRRLMDARKGLNMSLALKFKEINTFRLSGETIQIYE